jgi:hypothetical protein
MSTNLGLKSYGGKILKPFQNQSRGEKEHAFYEQIFHPSTAENKPLYKKLQAFVPSYYGTITLEETTKEQGVLHNGSK